VSGGAARSAEEIPDRLVVFRGRLDAGDVTAARDDDEPAGSVGGVDEPEPCGSMRWERSRSGSSSASPLMQAAVNPGPPAIISAGRPFPEMV